MDTDRIVARLQETRQAVLEHFDLGAPALERSYAAGKWSAGMILAHLADAEVANYWRVVRAVAEPGCTVGPYDQDKWANALNYAARPAELSRALFAAARDLLIHHARTLAPQQLEQGFAEHAEKGRLTGWEWAQLICAHTEHHLGQLRAARDGTEWQPVHTPDSWRYTGLSKPASAAAASS